MQARQGWMPFIQDIKNRNLTFNIDFNSIEVALPFLTDAIGHYFTLNYQFDDDSLMTLQEQLLTWQQSAKQQQLDSSTRRLALDLSNSLQYTSINKSLHFYDEIVTKSAQMPVGVHMNVQDWSSMINNSKNNQFAMKKVNDKYDINTEAGVPCLQVCVKDEPQDQEAYWTLETCFNDLLSQKCDPEFKTNIENNQGTKLTLIEYAEVEKKWRSYKVLKDQDQLSDDQPAWKSIVRKIQLRKDNSVNEDDFTVSRAIRLSTKKLKVNKAAFRRKNTTSAQQCSEIFVSFIFDLCFEAIAMSDLISDILMIYGLLNSEHTGWLCCMVYFMFHPFFACYVPLINFQLERDQLFKGSQVNWGTNILGIVTVTPLIFVYLYLMDLVFIVNVVLVSFLIIMVQLFTCKFSRNQWSENCLNYFFTKFFNMSTMDVLGFHRLRTITQLLFESFPQIFLQTWILYKVKFSKAKNAIGVDESVIGASIVFAFLHLAIESTQLYNESQACQTSFIHYGVTCLNGRFGWVPFTNNLNQVKSMQFQDKEVQEYNFDQIKSKCCRHTFHVHFEFNDATIDALSKCISNMPTHKKKGQEQVKLIFGESINPNTVKNFSTFLKLVLISSKRVSLDLEQVNVEGIVKNNKDIELKIQSKKTDDIQEHIMVQMTKIGNCQMLQKLHNLRGSLEVFDSFDRSLMMIACDQKDLETFSTLYFINNEQILTNDDFVENKTIYLTLRYQMDIYKQCKKRLSRVYKRNQVHFGALQGTGEKSFEENDTTIEADDAEDFNLMCQIMSNMFVFSERCHFLEEENETDTKLFEMLRKTMPETVCLLTGTISNPKESILTNNDKDKEEEDIFDSNIKISTRDAAHFEILRNIMVKSIQIQPCVDDGHGWMFNPKLLKQELKVTSIDMNRRLNSKHLTKENVKLVTQLINDDPAIKWDLLTEERVFTQLDPLVEHLRLDQQRWRYNIRSRQIIDDSVAFLRVDDVSFQKRIFFTRENQHGSSHQWYERLGIECQIMKSSDQAPCCHALECSSQTIVYSHKAGYSVNDFGWKLHSLERGTWIRFNAWVRFSSMPSQEDRSVQGIEIFDRMHNSWIDKCKPNEWAFISVVDKVRIGEGDNKIVFYFYDNYNSWKMHIAHLSFEVGHMNRLDAFEPQKGKKQQDLKILMENKALANLLYQSKNIEKKANKANKPLLTKESDIKPVSRKATSQSKINLLLKNQIRDKMISSERFLSQRKVNLDEMNINFWFCQVPDNAMAVKNIKIKAKFQQQHTLGIIVKYKDGLTRESVSIFNEEVEGVFEQTFSITDVNFMSNCRISELFSSLTNIKEFTLLFDIKPQANVNWQVGVEYIRHFLKKGDWKKFNMEREEKAKKKNVSHR